MSGTTPDASSRNQGATPIPTAVGCRRRTDRRYRRQCACCSKFLPKERKSSYCSPCNAERRRRDRAALRSEQRQRAEFKRAYGKWGENTLEVMRFLISACGRD